MNKKVLIITLLVGALLLVAGQGFAQISYGVIGGVGLAGFAGDDRNDFDSRLGLTAGAFMETPLWDVLILHPEAMLSLRGAGFAGSGDKATLWYLDIPVLVKYQLPINVGVPINVMAGPYLGINLSAKYVNGTTTDADDDFKNFDFGLQLGAGVEIDSFMINARYRAGLTDIAESDIVDITNSELMLLVGYRIR
jgi:opacity protein-like surface antigen